MKPIIQKLGLLVAMLLAVLPSSAYDFEVDDICYTITSTVDLTVSVDGVIDSAVSDITIPNKVEYKGKALTVLEIGKDAFRDLKQLTTISLPSSLISIGAGAFRGCIALKEFTFPIGVNAIPPGLFSDCSNLSSVYLHNQIMTVGYSAFKSTGITRIELPQSISTIPQYCFAQCTKLEEIVFNVSSIEENAFYGCISLKKIDLPENLQSISFSAFENCQALTEFTITPNVCKISASAIWDCHNIKKLTIGTGLKGLPTGYVHNQDHYAQKYDITKFYSLENYYERDDSRGILRSEIKLQGLKEIIIEDDESDFSIKGSVIAKQGVSSHTCIPAFANIDLDYFYIGRPLTDISKWNVEGYSSVRVNVSQGYGQIHTLEIAGYCTENPYFYQKVDTLILGTGINKFIPDNLCTNSLSKIVCRSIIPPTISGSYSNFTTKNFTDVIVCVPYGCKEAYENADFWKSFWNIEELPEIPAEEIILSVSEATIPINETVTIDATILPAETSDKSITWISSNPGVAEVSEEGTVKGISIGTATITAMCGTVSATCTVTVSEASEINSVTAVQNHKIQVYNLQGILIGSCNNEEELNTLPKGVYIVVSNGKRSKIKI